SKPLLKERSRQHIAMRTETRMQKPNRSLHRSKKSKSHGGSISSDGGTTKESNIRKTNNTRAAQCHRDVQAALPLYDCYTHTVRLIITSKINRTKIVPVLVNAPPTPGYPPTAPMRIAPFREQCF